MTDDKKDKKIKKEWLVYTTGIRCPTVEELLAAGYSLDEANEIIAEWRLNHPGEE